MNNKNIQPHEYDHKKVVKFKQALRASDKLFAGFSILAHTDAGLIDAKDIQSNIQDVRSYLFDMQENRAKGEIVLYNSKGSAIYRMVALHNSALIDTQITERFINLYEGVDPVTLANALETLELKLL